ncbi:TPA: EpsG family protein [Vibrio parahaemolyticus]|uniref:EpsG family protein n=2 Tax=Vibrio parahaemolyticus TaxID=670 RepID=UPI001E502039|nr:EpsG family protein [Vibrio parahaemolyticus]HCG7972809.1 EpsG family protein [Vibrio parahaemolyticus]
MSFSIRSPIKLLMVMIFPLASILSLFNRYSIRDNKVNSIVISLSISIVAYAFIPYKELDLASHYYSYLSIQDTYSISDFRDKSFGLNSIFYMLSEFNLSFRLIPFIFVFLSIYSLLYVTHNVIIDNKSDKYHAFCFFCIICAFSFMNSANGLRNGLASCLFIVCAYRYFHTNKFPWSLSTIAMLTHPYVVLPLLFSVLAKNLTTKSVYLTILVVSFFIYISDGAPILGDVVLVTLFGHDMGSVISNVYLGNGRWGSGSTSNFFVFLFARLPYISLLFWLFFRFDMKNIWNRLSVLNLSVIIVFFDYSSISGRYIYLGTLVLLMSYFLTKDKMTITNYLARCFIVLSLLASVAWGVYQFRSVIIPANIALVKPFVYTLFSNEGYSQIKGILE